MSEHVAKVLEMTRLEAGAIELERDWHALGEIAGAVLRRLAERLARTRSWSSCRTTCRWCASMRR